jgi:hypothetical protein
VARTHLAGLRRQLVADRAGHAAALLRYERRLELEQHKARMLREAGAVCNNWPPVCCLGRHQMLEMCGGCVATCASVLVGCVLAVVSRLEWLCVAEVAQRRL